MRRPYQRSLRLSVKRSGHVVLSCQKSVSSQQITEFLNLHAKWIEKCQKKFAELRERFPPKTFVDGEAFPFLGRELTWKFVVASDGLPSVKIQSPHILAQATHAKQEWRSLVSALYLEKAKFYLPHRLVYWSEEMNLKFRKIKIRMGKSHWGSCSHDGKISLNAKLMFFSKDIIDYVIIHELAHLVHPNHSINFWNLVAQFCPNHKLRRRKLRLEGARPCF